PAPAHRPPAPPVTSRPPRRRRGGCGAWFLVAFILVALLAVAGAIALSNAGVFGPNGLFGRSTPSTPSTTTSLVTTTTAPDPAAAAAPAAASPESARPRADDGPAGHARLPHLGVQ